VVDLEDQWQIWQIIGRSLADLADQWQIWQISWQIWQISGRSGRSVEDLADQLASKGIVDDEGFSWHSYF